MSNSPAPDVLIVGAGIGGLTAAIALQQRGFKVLVTEQAAQLGEVGAGLTLTPNVTRILFHLGLEQQLAKVFLIPELQLIRHWQSGDTLVEKHRGQHAIDTYGFPYGHIHRADLHALLAGEVLRHDPASILLGKAAIDVETSATSAIVTYKDGATIEAGLVIGCDGVRSMIREQLFESTPPRFTGHVAWRAIVPATHIPKHIAAAPPGLFLGPGRLFMRYPVRHGNAWNYAAFARQPGWTTESWTARASVSDPLEVFEGWHDVVRETIAASPPDGVFKWALYARDPLNTWTHGRVTLLGDAAHAMLPFLGQGAALSIEDGLVLARCLAQVPNIEAALGRYEAIRKQRCDDTQIEAATIADRLQAQEAGDYGKGPIRDEETMGYYTYDAVNIEV